MKRLLAILISGLFYIAGCGSSDTIKIGVIVPKSGPLATYGLENSDGIKTAVKKINDAGGIQGKKIELFIEDNQGTTTETINAYKKLVTANGVVAVIGPVTSGNSLAVKPLVAQYKTPLVSPTGTAVALTLGNEYMSRVCFIDPFQGKIGAVFAFNDLKKKKAVIMFDSSNDYSSGLADAFEKEFKALGGILLKRIGFKSDDKDFNAQLTEIKRMNPEIIYVPSYHPTAGPIMNQARKQGITAVLIGGDGWDSGKLKDLAGEGYEGNYFTSHFSGEDTDPFVQKFIKSFKAMSQQNPGSMASLGYDAALLLADSIDRTMKKLGASALDKSEFKEELKNQINSTKNFKGVTGNITLDENRNAVKSVVIIKNTPAGPKFYKKVTI